MKALIYTLHTLQPVLFSSYRPGDENSSTSLGYVPGSAMRGLLAGRYLQRHPVDTPALDPHFRRLFLEPSTRYLHAYPEDRRRQRALPVPLSWRIEKSDREAKTHPIWDFALEKEDLENPVRVRQDFCRVDEDEDKVVVTFVRAKREVRYHNASPKRMHKGKEESTVFRYEAIAAGERLKGVILGEEEVLEEIQALLNQEPIAHLGRSRSAGYGTVSIEEVRLVDNFREFTPYGDERQSGTLVLTLLSDTILRHPATGQWTDDLALALGKPKRSWQEAYYETTVVGGFNRAWRSPLPQAVALRAGSVFVFAADAFTFDELERLQQDGVGERRSEGFGRVAVNWQGSSGLEKQDLPQESWITSSITLSPKSQEIARRMAERMLRAELDRRLAAHVARLDIRGNISNAQIGRLRTVIRRAQREHSYEPVKEYLKALKSTARQQLERARVDNERMLLWLQEAVDVNDEGVTVWHLWEDYLATRDFGLQVADISPEITDALKLEYTLRLIDAVLHKKSRGGEA